MSEETQARQLVVFTLGAEHYALPIQQVHEIIRYTQPRSVASRTDWVRGVISLRGRIVPVYDLAARLGVTSELSEQTKIVIVETESDTAGVIVDDVEEVLTVEDEQIEEVPGADCVADRIDREGRRAPRRAAEAGHDLRRADWPRPRRPTKHNAQHSQGNDDDHRHRTRCGCRRQRTDAPDRLQLAEPSRARRSSAPPPTATRRSRCASASSPTR